MLSTDSIVVVVAVVADGIAEAATKLKIEAKYQIHSMIA